MLSSGLNHMFGIGLFTETQLQELAAITKEFGYAPIKAALNFGFLSRPKYVEFLERSGYKLIDVRAEIIDEFFVEQCDLIDLNAQLYLPLRRDARGNLLVAAADPYDENLQVTLEAKFNTKVQFLAASDLDITWMVHKLRGEYYVKESVFSLMKNNPDSSGLVTFTDKQLIALFLMIALAMVLLTFRFVSVFIFFNLFFSGFFLFSIVFKLFIALRGSKYEMNEAVTKDEVKAVDEDSLPVYTILLPVYKEDKLIRKLIWNLRSLDYPRGKLDVKLLLEEDDDKTLNAVRNLDFPANFETIVVPFHLPKTKPKACNYGLFFCKGKYLTIYDAEDVPDSDQLKKVVCLFRKLPKDYVVVQGALNYFNKNENLLTRMFTLEYSYWFDYMLPGLQSIDVPIPLGGTSNHFKLDRLMELGGWDPFNVTEDADLGVRVFEQRYKVGVVNSTTLEEANNEPFNWIRQRSRWIKGYMQTSLVHLRNPAKLIQKIGWRGFFGFNFFVSFTPVTFLLYPVLLAFYAVYLTFDLKMVSILFPDWVLYISIFNFVAGNTLMVYVNMLAVFKRKYYELILYAIVNPLYWLMHSIAAYKGLWQLVYNPFYWEKTNHGLTKVTHSAAVAAANVPITTEDN